MNRITSVSTLYIYIYITLFISYTQMILSLCHICHFAHYFNICTWTDEWISLTRNDDITFSFRSVQRDNDWPFIKCIFHSLVFSMNEHFWRAKFWLISNNLIKRRSTHLNTNCHNKALICLSVSDFRINIFPLLIRI